MEDLFNDLNDDDFNEESLSDVLAETTPLTPAETAPLTPAETAPLDLDDEFDQLRRKTTRTGSTYDEMDTSVDSEFSDDSSGFSFSMFTTSQKLVLLALLLLDIVAVGFGFLVLLGRI